MEQSWRWFGPDDAVPLSAIRQAGASGVVTALHQIPYGELWTTEAIEERKALIARDVALGLHWNVVESLPIHERIKLGEGDLSALFDTYRQSMRNLAAAGIKIICYNFMPVVDWTRTELYHPLPGGGRALRFNAHEYAAFDCFMLARPGAEADHPPKVLARARNWFDRASESDKATLLSSIMAGLPGAFDRYDIPALRAMLRRYHDVSADTLRERLVRFLREIIPTAEEVGIRMAIHPDDPPRPLMGLPRIVSTQADLDVITASVDSPANGITLCTGSLGAGTQNDVPAIARHCAQKIHFVHLRNVAKEPDGSFMEADHLAGDTDMVAVVETLLTEQARRRNAGDKTGACPSAPTTATNCSTTTARRVFPATPPSAA